MINQVADKPSSRARLVFAAMQLFAAKGYGGTSVADVLHAAQMNSGSLYYFFPGKQDLLLAVLDQYRSGIDEMLLRPAWHGVDDPIERIFALLARYRLFLVQTDCTYGCPIGSLALELHEPDPAVRVALAANFAAWVDAIERCLKGGAKDMVRGVDTRALAEFVLTTMEGAVMQTRIHRDIGYFDRAVEQLRNYLGGLLRHDKRRKSTPRNAIRRKARA